VVVYAPRERVRMVARAAFARRRGRVVVVRSAAEMAHAFRTQLVDAALVDVGAPADETWRAAALAREFPSAPFFAMLSLRVADGTTLARCAALDFADVLVDGMDDAVARELMLPHAFSSRFSEALRTPPPPLALDTPMQRRAWEWVVSHAGRPVRTDGLAQALRVTREHLSRTFATGGAPNLKRVIDLVRVAAAAELAKNPGYDVRDVARVLGFSSASHLSTTAQRVVGTRPASLARLRTVDLLERFAQGRTRSRR
jgi:transcriptional regulator GlxA family with amidase domain